MQAQHAPRYGADPERRPQLIAEANWRRMSRYRELRSGSSCVAWYRLWTGRAERARWTNLVTSSWRNSLDKNAGVTDSGISSEMEPVNNNVAGSTVAQKAASMGMILRNRRNTSTWRVWGSRPA